MYKAKLFGFAVACMLGLGSINPITVLAADTHTESASVSESNKNQKDNRAAFEEAMRKANEKWNALDSKQKEQAYSLVENEVKAEMQLLDKLAELGVMEKNDVAFLKNNMQVRFNNLKSSGQFPFAKQRGPKSRK
jgi:hypothetical protein